jgi:hypothetical protein
LRSPFADILLLIAISIAGLSSKLASCFEIAFHMTWATILNGCLAALACWYAMADVPALVCVDWMATVNAWQRQPALD